MENVLFPARIARTPIEPVEHRARCAAAIRRPAALEVIVRTSFPGDTPRLSICRALINDPSILLMDEPFAPWIPSPGTR